MAHHVNSFLVVSLPILSDIFAKRLKRLREAAGLSKVDLAEKLGVSDNQIRRWESGTARPRPEKEDLLAEIFQIDPINLYSPEGAAGKPEPLIPETQSALNKDLSSLVRRLLDEREQFEKQIESLTAENKELKSLLAKKEDPD